MIFVNGNLFSHEHCDISTTIGKQPYSIMKVCIRMANHGRCGFITKIVSELAWSQFMRFMIIPISFIVLIGMIFLSCFSFCLLQGSITIWVLLLKKYSFTYGRFRNFYYIVLYRYYLHHENTFSLSLVIFFISFSLWHSSNKNNKYGYQK